jgi:hypothetical protein
LERKSLLRKAGTCLAFFILGSVGYAQSLPPSAPKRCSVGQSYFSGSYVWNCSATDTWTLVNFNTLGTGGGGSGTGTVTHTLGVLSPNQLVFGNGNADIKSGNLTGDVTTAGGTATTLSSVTTAGTCGDATHGAIPTYDVKGRITSCTTTSAIGAGGGGSGISSGTLSVIPSTCSVGATYVATDQPVGQQMYFCTATNTWSQFLALGGSGALTFTNGQLDVVASVVPKLNAANGFTGSNTFGGTTTLNNVVINGTCSGTGCATGGGGGGTTVAANGPYLQVAGVNYIPSHMVQAVPFNATPFATSVGAPSYTAPGTGTVGTFTATSGRLNSSTRTIAANGIFHMGATCNLGSEATCGIVAEEGTAASGIQLYCFVSAHDPGNDVTYQMSPGINCYRFVNGAWNATNFRLNSGMSLADIWLGFEYNSTTQATTLVISGDGGRNWSPVWTIAKFNIFNTAPTKFGVGVGMNGTGTPSLAVLSLDVQ